MSGRYIRVIIRFTLLTQSYLLAGNSYTILISTRNLWSSIQTGIHVDAPPTSYIVFISILLYHRFIHGPKPRTGSQRLLLWIRTTVCILVILHYVPVDRWSCRVCPGTHLADSSIWINIAKSVAAFNVTKTVGPDGQVIVPVAETTDGMVVYVFQISFLS